MGTPADKDLTHGSEEDVNNVNRDAPAEQAPTEETTTDGDAKTDAEEGDEASDD